MGEMRAAVFHDKSQPLKLEIVPIPAFGDNDVLVKVAACGLCRTDLHYLQGLPTAKKPPIILGHEISGIVEQMGAGVTRFKKGDRVLIPPVFACGTCHYCRTGRGTICEKQTMVGNHRDGGFAEYISVPASDIFALPEPIPLLEGCIISDAISTPYHAVVNRGRVQPGEKVLVLGCGGVGLSLVQMAALAGGSVVAVDIFDEKLEQARRFGASEVVNARKVESLSKAIKKMTGGGADIAFEVIGNPPTIEEAFKAVRWGGRVIVVGYTHEDVRLNAGRIMFCEIEVKGSLGCGLQDYPRIIEMARTGRLRVREMVTHRFKLDEINEGFRNLESGNPQLIRSIVVME
ncbi:MAG: alcohol dehydrogenase catalytic domain-containing protein [Thermoplasmatota archaeon]